MTLEEKLELSFLIIINENDYRIVSFDKESGELYLMTMDGFDEKTMNIQELPKNVQLFQLTEV